ncbi:MAG: FAD-binding oxidoreductase [Microbacteriaceae bacterium]
MVDPAVIEALHTELLALLGERGVSREARALERASVDGAYLSPIISGKLPLGRAELVAWPRDAEQIGRAVGAAARHGVPVTARGKGTGNYGQAIPVAGGLVLDTSRARAILEVGDGFLVAEAGAPMAALEQAAVATGQQLLMYPSTANSTLGGFLSGGSGGTGSIRHASNSDGFVLALDVAYPAAGDALVPVEGDAAQPFVHSYGTAGVIARARVRLEPLQDWRGFYASFDAFEDALALIRPFAAIEPTPRLVSADNPVLSDALPRVPGLADGRASLRAILDVASLDEATRLVESVGGRMEDVTAGPVETMKISMVSYNHPIEWLQKAYPDTYFHVEVSGDALVERIDEVEAVYPGGMLHIESQHGRPIGMLAGEYTSERAVYAGFERLLALGVSFHNPHQWFVDFEPERTRALAARTDPGGLLNPGKLVEPTVVTGGKVS